MFSSEMLHTIFETDALGPCKILSEYWVSRDSSQAQAVFGFFEVKNKHRIFEGKPQFYKKNMQLTKSGKAVCDWAILPKHMQSKLDFTKSIFRSVSNNKIQDSKNFYWQIMKQELNK